MKNEGFKRFKPPNIWDIHGYTSKNEGNRGNSHGWTITLGWPCLLGAGLSAADAILHALGFEDVRVTHVFLGPFRWQSRHFLENLPKIVENILQRNKSQCHSGLKWQKIQHSVGGIWFRYWRCFNVYSSICNISLICTIGPQSWEAHSCKLKLLSKMAKGFTTSWQPPF